MRESGRTITSEVIDIAYSLTNWAAACGLSSLTVSTVVEEDGSPYISVRALDADGNVETWAVVKNAG